MKSVKIKEINFLIGDETGLTKSYPSNGFFISKTENGYTDLVFVNKNSEFVNFICPEEIFNSIFKEEEEIFSLPEKQEPKTDNYSGDFILEFARILLNRK